MTNGKSILLIYDDCSSGYVKPILSNANIVSFRLDEAPSTSQSFVACIIAKKESIKKHEEKIAELLFSIERTLWVIPEKPDDIPDSFSNHFDARIELDKCPPSSVLLEVLKNWNAEYDEVEDKIPFHLAREIAILRVEWNDNSSIVSEPLYRCIHDVKWKQGVALLSISGSNNLQIESYDQFRSWLINENSEIDWLISSTFEPNSVRNHITFVFSEVCAPKRKKRMRMLPSDDMQSLLYRSGKIHKERDSAAITEGKNWFEIVELLKKPRIVRRLLNNLELEDKKLIKQIINIC